MFSHKEIKAGLKAGVSTQGILMKRATIALVGAIAVTLIIAGCTATQLATADKDLGGTPLQPRPIGEASPDHAAVPVAGSRSP